MLKRGNRNQLSLLPKSLYNVEQRLTMPVIATKYTTNYLGGTSHPQIMTNYNGNGSKSLNLSVDASLKKLRTSYIDVVKHHCSISA